MQRTQHDMAFKNIAVITTCAIVFGLTGPPLCRAESSNQPSTSSGESQIIPLNILIVNATIKNSAFFKSIQTKSVHTDSGTRYTCGFPPEFQALILSIYRWRTTWTMSSGREHNTWHPLHFREDIRIHTNI